MFILESSTSFFGCFHSFFKKRKVFGNKFSRWKNQILFYNNNQKKYNLYRNPIPTFVSIVILFMRKTTLNACAQRSVPYCKLILAHLKTFFYRFVDTNINSNLWHHFQYKNFYIYVHSIYLMYVIVIHSLMILFFELR